MCRRGKMIYTWTRDGLKMLCSCGMSHQRLGVGCWTGSVAAFMSQPVCWQLLLIHIPAFTVQVFLFSLEEAPRSHPQRLLLNKAVGADGCEMCVCVCMCGLHVAARLCGWLDLGNSGDDGARCSESAAMHHSLTGREQSPVTCTQCNQQLLVSTEQQGEGAPDKPLYSYFHLINHRDMLRETCYVLLFKKFSPCFSFLISRVCFLWFSRLSTKSQKKRNYEETQETAALSRKPVGTASDIRWVSR